MGYAILQIFTQLSVGETFQQCGRNVVMYESNIGMPISCALKYIQSPFVLRDGLIVLALTVVRASEVVDRGGRIDVIHSECLLFDPQRTFIMCDRLIVLALTVVRASEVVDRLYKIMRAMMLNRK
jgi:hypothetical protein